LLPLPERTKRYFAIFFLAKAMTDSRPPSFFTANTKRYTSISRKDANTQARRLGKVRD
jgi:hypothetical protein